MPLKRSLGFFDAYAIGIGSIIGAGIFVVLGVAAQEAGPAILISLIIGAAVSSFSALSFAELAQKIPKDGGGYEFTHEMISPYAGYVSGWMWLVSNLVSGAVVAIGFGQYLSLVIPHSANVIAAIACICITGLNYWGAKESSRVNDFLVTFKLAALGIFVVLGLFLFKTSYFSPFAPKGIGGIMTSAALVFFAYSGFGRVAMVSEEVKDPERNVPLAIIAALVTSTIVYIGVAAVSIGLIGWQSLGSSSSPLVSAGSAVSPTMSRLLGVAALAATLSVLLTTVLGISRITYAMSRNGDMARQMTKVHPVHGTPYVAILIFGALMTIMAFFTDLLFAAAVSNLTSLGYYALVNLSAMRIRNPKYPRMIPMLGMVSCLLLMVFLDLYAWILGASVLAIVSFVYYIKKKEFMQKRPEDG